MKSTKLDKLAKINGDDFLMLWWRFSRNWRGRSDEYHARSKSRLYAKHTRRTLGRSRKVFDKLCKICDF